MNMILILPKCEELRRNVESIKNSNVLFEFTGKVSSINKPI